MTDASRRITLRPAGGEDEALLCRIFAANREGPFNAAGLPEPEIARLLLMQREAQLRQYRSLFPDATVDVILVDGTPVGYLHVDRGEERYTLVDVAFLPATTGQGIGTHVVGAFLREASAAGKSVSAHVEKDNPAWRLWQRLGFRVVDDDGVYLKIECLP
jgi:ribosomal protein S18 acetylase RimI-like enzyme